MLNKKHRSKPLFSVIVPVYNVERYLVRCVDSILSQSFENFELILVNDGSPDGSPAICDTFATTDSRVVVIHKTNGGLSSARNLGIENASGKYLMFVDSDDWIAPNTLRSVKGYISDADVLRINFNRSDGERNVSRELLIEAGRFDSNPLRASVLAQFLLKREPCYSCMLIIRTDSLGALRFNEDVAWLEDTLFFVELVQQIESIVVIPNAYYTYFVNSESLSLNPANIPTNLLAAAQVGELLTTSLAQFSALDRDTLSKIVISRLDLLGRQLVSSVTPPHRVLQKEELRDVIVQLAESAHLQKLATKTVNKKKVYLTSVLIHCVVAGKVRMATEIAWLLGYINGLVRYGKPLMQRLRGS